VDPNAEQIRLDLARLVYEQADSAEKRTLTAAERRKCAERQKRINELCIDLRRMAAKAHADREKKIAQ
jgi:hypothetical protein